MGGRDLHALERVADVEEAARLAALPVDSDRVADHRLYAEAVQSGAEDLVVVEARGEPRVELGLVRLDAVDDALVEVRGAQAPDAAGEVEVVRVVHLRQVVERTRQLRVRKYIGATLVMDLDVALFDVDVGRAVLAHRAELDDVAVGHVLADREHQVEGADHVRLLREHRVLARLHRERRGRLLRVVDHHIGQHLGHNAVEEVALVHVADVRLDPPARVLLPRRDTLLEGRDRSQRIRGLLKVPIAAREVVDKGNLMSAGGKTKGGRPAEIAVPAQNQDLHSGDNTDGGRFANARSLSIYKNLRHPPHSHWM